MKQLVFIFSLVFFVAAFDDNTLIKDAKKVSEGMDMLLKTSCDRYGTSESYDNAMSAKEDMQFCMSRVINHIQQEIQQEMEKVMRTGDFSTVFRMYCRKGPQLRDCVTNFTEAMKPCVSPGERITMKITNNMTDALISFICFQEGERIALFIAEGGRECLKSKQEEIEQCFTSTFSKYVPKEMPDNREIPLFKLGEPDCGDVFLLQKCVVGHLEKCSKPTPGNIVDSMFKSVLKVTPCQQYQSDAQTGTASAASVNTFALATSALLALAVKLH